MIRAALVCGALVFGVLLPPQSASGSDPKPGARRNQLAGEASPYLQLHVYNPVDWYPWGAKALEKARLEDKPIFLSVGYSTCYWCHVMEREVFSDEKIAALMNESFVNVKVDREERPDIDEIYMQATRLLTGSGGWPNSVFMTPEGKPFFAGTYFPPADSEGRAGFPTIVAGLAKRWKEQRAEVVARAEQVAAAIAAGFESRQTGAASFDPKELLARSVESLARQFDEEHGGFGERTKFPSPPQLELLLAAHQRRVPGRAAEMLRKTLDEMAYGGIHDHLAGGFHRYSTEPTWSIPHFEKMLYDNAQLVGLYARAHRVFGDPLYRQVAEGIAAYLASEMTHPLGGLHSAQDAEVAGEEGGSYLWTEQQVVGVVGAEDARELLASYRIVPVDRGGAGPGALRLRTPIEKSLVRTGAKDAAALVDRFASHRAKLLARRSQREQPLRDDKVLAAWNGLAIRGLVDAGVELGHPEYVDQAARAANFVLSRLQDRDGRLRRSYIAGQAREYAVLDDYVFLADGLVALHSASGDPRWLPHARRLADHMIAEHEGPPGTGFYLQSSARDPGDLFVRPRILTDNVMPAGNTVALRVLRDLAMYTGDARYREAADRTQLALGDLFERAPAAVGTAVRSLASGPQLPAPPRKRAATGTSPPRLALDRIPTGRDFVSGRLERRGSIAVVVLEIAEGWHVNANPASLDFLIPTKVQAADGGAVDVRYPKGSPYHPRFSREPLSVYEGAVQIPVETKARKLSLTFQACDDSSCLPPETVELSAP